MYSYVIVVQNLMLEWYRISSVRLHYIGLSKNTCFPLSPNESQLLFPFFMDIGRYETVFSPCPVTHALLPLLVDRRAEISAATFRPRWSPTFIRRRSLSDSARCPRIGDVVCNLVRNTARHFKPRFGHKSCVHNCKVLGVKRVKPSISPDRFRFDDSFDTGGRIQARS